ncbi:YncE family protein [Phenylobacterium hankyongense]|uniref:YncE family protein n=2 Tax=Phenylobacterium hankyongense TaxID=1813876 RepID=A0A328AZV4_9CAUL|nr:YncE family protein [Phenylobacterium hankyongense]
MRRFTLGAALAVFALAAANVAHARSGYRLEAAVTLNGPSPGWDYLSVDPTRDYVFIGRRKAGVTVYDAAGGRVVATIENSKDANVAALVPEVDRGFTANEDGSTTVFQLSTLKTLDRVKLGEGADAGFYEPMTGQMVFTLGDTHELVFVAARSAKITGRLPIKADELEAAAADGKGFIYVNERDKDRVAKVDVRTRKLVAEWPTPGCRLPTGLAIDRAAGRLFLGCKGPHPVLAVMNAKTGRVVTTMEIGRGNDGVVFDPAGKRVFTSNGIDGNIVVFDVVGPDRLKLASAFTTRPIARTMAFNPTTGRIYTATAEGVLDPTQPVNRRAGAFYPNRYLDDTFTLLIYAPE